VAESDIVYFNGEVISSAEARLPINDRGVLFGLGFFETFRTSGGKPHHWRFNRARIEETCRRAQISFPSNSLIRDEERLRAIVRRILEVSGMADAVFRYTVTAGSMDGEGREILAIRSLPADPPADGISLRVLSLPRDNGEWLPRPKSLNYANAYLGARELDARASHASEEGLFLSRDGAFVVETPRQNIAWVCDGALRYPDFGLGAIPGTCLRWVLGLGIPAEPRRAKLEELIAADAIFVLNAVRGITPVRELWDVTDRSELCVMSSHQHPVVVSLRHQWAEALAATAASA
jgi:4-amino-4-deoxychorismate lyase